MDNILSEYEEITDLDFNFEGAHLAICSKDQGGSANGWHQSLMLKAEDIELSESMIKSLRSFTVEMPIEQFLVSFFNMYERDAQLLAMILNLKSELEEAEDENEEESTEVEDYKETMHDNPEYNLEEDRANDYESLLASVVDKLEILRSVNSLTDLKTEVIVETLNIQRQFEKGVMQYNIDLNSFNNKEECTVAKAQEQAVEQVVDTVTPEVNVEDVMKSTEVQDLIKQEIAKAVEAAQAEIVKAKEAEVESVKAELAKATEALSVFKAEKEAQRKAGVEGFVKSLTFISEDKFDATVEAVFKMADIDGADVIVSALEAAQAEIVKAKETFVNAEAGVEVKEETIVIDKATAMADKLAAKYAGKDFL